MSYVLYSKFIKWKEKNTEHACPMYRFKSAMKGVRTVYVSAVCVNACMT